MRLFTRTVQLFTAIKLLSPACHPIINYFSLASLRSLRGPLLVPFVFTLHCQLSDLYCIVQLHMGERVIANRPARQNSYVSLMYLHVW